MNSNTTVRETKSGAAETVREKGSQKTQETAREFASHVSASIGLQKFRDYSIVQQLPSSGAESDIYVVSKGTDKFILKLYRFGIEPKIEIINKIVNLSRAYPRELIHVFEFSFDEGTKRWFEIQEYAQHGSLKKLIDDIPKLDGKEQNTILLSILRQVSDSLKLLHENQILHLDLKPANVLVRSLEPVDIVLIDFGISGSLDSELSKRFTAVRGTPMYQSPESWIGAVGNPSDWWSLGMLILEIANGKHPFEGLPQQVIASLLTTKAIEIPGSVSPDKKELLRGLLTRDMSKRWGHDQVSRWLGGERGIPVYFEEAAVSAPASQGQTQNENMRPLAFMGEKHTSLDTLARAVAADEAAWAKGRELLMRGNIRMWLEGNGESGQAEDIDILVEDAEDPDGKLFRFVHRYGKQLPFVFMGKRITFDNLHFFLGKNLRNEKQSKSEAAVAERFCDGKLSSLLDFYLRHNESNDEFEGLTQIFSTIQGKTPQAVFEYLDVIRDIQKSAHGHFRKAVEGYDEEIKRRIAEKKRIEEERLAEEKRIEEERLAEEKERKRIESERTMELLRSYATSTDSTPAQMADLPAGLIILGGYDWRVLDTRNGRALILSERIIESKKYNESYTSVTWETCALREYLNGEFYNRFSADEKALIAETRIMNDNNPWYGASGGNDTNDKIFLLSIEEVVKYFGDSGQLKNKNPKNEYYIDDQYDPSRIAINANDMAWWWWLRPPGYSSDAAAYVSNVGRIILYGNNVLYGSGGVRPALWLNL